MSLPPSVIASRLMVKARIRHLQVLVKVAEYGSIQRAAAAIGLTQPTTTTVLADLETLLDCELFQRHARGVRPTQIGKHLIPIARRALDGMQELASVASAMAGEASSVVRVVAISSAVSGVLSDILPNFSAAHPDTLVQIQELDIENIGALIGTGEVDVALCRQPVVIPTGWSFTKLASDRLIVACGPQHPLAGRRQVTLEELWRETWMLGPAPSAPRTAFDSLTANAGVTPPLRLVSSRCASIFWAMLQAQEIVALLPYRAVYQMLNTGQLCEIDVQLPLAFEPIGVLKPTQDVTDATIRFVDFLEMAAPRLKD
ncbi:LysR family transcriptional regulator [Ottowia thiooxydans]|uniref:LysR family transcriptional regulator n=1 Tax=Ottowia thiooxydans TaxID=219182 RepID=UPI00041155EA|nr:LysR family transcriptional regulator [Ottowia thiooxydans]